MSVVFVVFALGERILVVGAAYRREGARQRDGTQDDLTVRPGEAEAGMVWFERSQILHFSTIREIDIHQVQCLTLQATFQASVNAMPMSWLLANQALRIAMDIGLHVSGGRRRGRGRGPRGAPGAGLLGQKSAGRLARAPWSVRAMSHVGRLPACAGLCSRRAPCGQWHPPASSRLFCSVILPDARPR